MPDDLASGTDDELDRLLASSIKRELYPVGGKSFFGFEQHVDGPQTVHKTTPFKIVPNKIARAAITTGVSAAFANQSAIVDDVLLQIGKVSDQQFNPLADPATVPNAQTNLHGPSATRKTSRLRHLRFAGVMAACVSVGLVISLVYSSLTKRGLPIAVLTAVESINAPISTVSAPAEFASQKWWETYDEGTVLLNNQTPARKLRRVQYEKNQWRKSDGQTGTTITSPTSDVIFINLDTQ